VTSPQTHVDVPVEAPLEDRLQQLIPAAPAPDPDDAPADTRRREMPVEANEADVLDQSIEVPLDEDYQLTQHPVSVRSQGVDVECIVVELQSGRTKKSRSEFTTASGMRNAVL
jgi:hypothetical protein